MAATIPRQSWRAWLCGWAIQSVEDTVLEPRCGDGAFLGAATKRLQGLGTAPAKIGRLLKGVEITPEEAQSAIIETAAEPWENCREGRLQFRFLQLVAELQTACFQCYRGQPAFHSLPVVPGTTPLHRHGHHGRSGSETKPTDKYLGASSAGAASTTPRENGTQTASSLSGFGRMR